MKKLKSALSVLAATVLSSALILPLAACDDDGGKNSVLVTSVGGKALANVSVEIYDGSKLVAMKNTDKDGKTSFDLKDGTYTVRLSSLPAGYYFDQQKTIKSSDTVTTLLVPSRVITSGTPSGKYVTGDVMYDFQQTVYTYDAENPEVPVTKTVKLSEVLEEKKAVVLNFWYVGCIWCEREYPAMKAAYEAYADDIEIFGINDHGDGDSKVKAQTVKDEVPYLMCNDSAGVGQLFEKEGYPFSVMIDRYGVVCEMTITQTEQAFWNDWFEKYTDPNYSPDYEEGNNGVDFVADKPEDFGVKMSETQLISRAINKTGNSMLFSEDVTRNTDGGKSAWPWDLTEDKTAIYPTNSGHRGTYAIMYAEVEVDKDQVLAFDYKVSSLAGNDYFYVAVDAREGIGKQVLMVSGQQDWTTGYAYVALEKGTHEIAFTYVRTSANGAYDDKAYIKNLRFTTIDEMNTDLLQKDETLELAYPSVRQYYDDELSVQNEVEKTYLAKDGYYHVGTKKDGSESENDPYLFADLTHSTPFFADATTSIFTVFSEKKNTGGVWFNGKNYTGIFDSYTTYSTNSDYKGMVPVTDTLKEMLDAYYNDSIPENSPYHIDEGWKLFCVSHRSYGKPVTLKDPIKGLAFFSAFDAHETTGMPDDAKDLNHVTFDTIIMPRGYVYAFTPSKSGVYSFRSTDTYIFENYLEDINAFLYDGKEDLAPHLSTPLEESGSDRFYRYGGENNFHIYHYLNAGETYYLSVAFNTVETIGSFDFRIDYIGDTYEYLHTVTSEIYSGDEHTLPIYTKVTYDSAKDRYVDSNGNPIYCDLTEVNFFFDTVSIEHILNASKSFFDFSGVGLKLPNETIIGKDFTDDMKAYFKKAVPNYNASFTGTVDGEPIELKLTKNYLTATYKGKSAYAAIDIGKMSDEKGQTVTLKFGEEVKDVPLTLKLNDGKLLISSGATDLGNTTYTAHHTNDGNTDLYGMVEVDKNLYNILQLANYMYRGYDNDNEWLMSCWYKVTVKA